MVIFVWGYAVYHKMVSAPADAMEIQVIGKQWLWQFQYDDGRSTINEFYVPVNRPVRLKMTSTDVLHSFFIPNFRVKQDVVPGMYSSVWFEATVPGKHQVYCTEYCGAAHSKMLAHVVALEPEDWENWKRGKKILAEEKPQLETPSRAEVQVALVDQGKAHFQAKGCVACHSVDGASKGSMGPTLKGVFGTSVDLMSGGPVVADENYIRESIENPTAKIVKGFNPIMPTFKGLISDMEMNALIAYIKSLK